MPRNVRNFWIEGNINGKATKIASGPVRKDGGFTLTIYMRNKGEVCPVVDISGWTNPDGKPKQVLHLDIAYRDGIGFDVCNPNPPSIVFER